MTTLSDIERLELDLDQAQKSFLRDRGWNFTSGHPGCVWLWDKTIDGKMYCVDQHVALIFEEEDPCE